MTEQKKTNELSSAEGLLPAPVFTYIAIGTGSRVAHIPGQIALAPVFSVTGEGDLRQ